MENPVFLIALIVGSIILLSVCFVYIRHQVLPLGGIALSLIGMILMGLSVWKSVDISIDDTGIRAKLDQAILVAHQAQEDASEAQRVSQQSLEEVGTVKVQTEKTIQASMALRDSLETLKVQQLLRDNNLYKGKIDGKLNAKTLTSLKQLQQKKGISSTGKLDSKTLRALKLEPIENFPSFK